MLGEHLRFLICPHCDGGVNLTGHTLTCARGHTFDVARQGYVSLLGGKGRTVPGDTAAMVDARARFLSGGHFQPIADAVTAAGLAELARQHGRIGISRRADSDSPVPGRNPGCVVDLGAGTGYYLAHLATRLDRHGLIAADVSAHAMRRAAKLYPELAAVVADIRTGLPVLTGSADLVLDVFAPRNPAEIERVLAPDGSLLAVVPTTEHLAELVTMLGLVTVDPAKRDRMRRALETFLEPVGERHVSYQIRLNRDDVRHLVRMGPSAWHREPAKTDEQVSTLPDLVAVSVSVNLLTYRRPARD